jgi:hypothetical protein
VATAVQALGSVLVVMLLGQVMLGAWVSLTVTVKLQLPVDILPDVSVAVQVTVVVPLTNVEPEAGKQLVVAPGQLSLAVAMKLTTAVHISASVDWVMLPGQVTVGF